MQLALFVSIALGIISSSHSIVIQPGERLSQLTEVTSSSRLLHPLSSTALLVPDEEISDNVVFQLKSIGTSVQGYDNLKRISRAWDQDFQCEVGVTASISRISAISQDVMLVQWNVTWVPPTALWLEGTGKLLGPNNVEIVYVSYNHQSQKESKFSWRAVFNLFVDVCTRKELRVPLACIEGTTELTFSATEKSGASKLIRISEDLSYASDLKRGVLRNRKCAQDLRLFLESGRRLVNDPNEWVDKVAVSLPWQSVPGSSTLDIEPIEEGPVVAVAFVAIAALGVLVFAAVTAPELVGQSLFGPPNYIVQPEDLGSFY